MFNPDYIVAAVTAGGVGIGAGRWANHQFKERGAKRRDDADMRHSITGWPADQYSPARPGLVQTINEHVKSDEASFKEIGDKLDRNHDEGK